MNFSKNTTILRLILAIISFIIVSAILWNTYAFFKKFKQEERKKMEIIAEAQKSLVREFDTRKEFNLFRKSVLKLKNINYVTKQKIIKDAKSDFEKLSLSSGDNNLQILILNSNTSIPFIITGKEGKITGSKNLDSIKENDSIYLYKQLAIMKTQNKPITLSYSFENVKNTQHIYYRDSDLLTKLKFYPLALLLILLLFTAVIYLVFKSSKIAEQNKLWAGMAKETAHQIGTPLSSLLGWVEILRMNNTEESTVTEIEKDITRLNTIADRFSKIGSIPTLEKINLISETKITFDYLKARSSKQIEFNFKSDKSDVFVLANKQLFSWVIENVMKNAIDAMQGKGKLNIELKTDTSQVKILFNDSGKGILKSDFKKIFETGFTTKKRGWGLGLSLAKRIIEDYHNGRIYVKNSTLGKGSCIVVSLKKV